ncbi:MAG: sensor histidine kinase [archaeon]|nr:sensor histidine kinase [archaeon]
MNFEKSIGAHVIFFDGNYCVKGYNDSFANFFDIEEDLTGKHIDDLEMPADFADFILSGEEEIELSLNVKNRWIDVKKETINTNGTLIGHFFILEDVTDQIINNQELIALNSVIGDVQDVMSMSIHFKDAEGKYHWTPETYALIDREPRLGDENNNIFDSITVQNLDNIADNRPNIDDDVYVEDFTIITESGKTKYLRGTAHNVFDDEGNFLRLIMTAQDLTKEHLQEANLKILDSLMSDSNYQLGVGSYVHEIGSDYFCISKEAVDIAELNENEDSHMQLKSLSGNFVDSDAFKKEVGKLISGELDKIDNVWEYKSPKTGQIKKLHVINSIKVVGGRIFSFGGIKDVTSEMEKQEKLKHHNMELEMLIRESNHRIKNNLNLLLRFISLEKRFNKNNPEKIIENTVGRIESFSLLHEKIYNVDNFKDINVEEYLNSLISGLYSIFGDDGSINYNSNNNELILNSEILVPLSLIITELVINSIKYGYVDYELDNKAINVSVDKFDNKLILHYSDNGKGLPKDFNPHKSIGLGWRIINSLISQLEGEYEVFNDDGMHFKLTFNI